MIGRAGCEAGREDDGQGGASVAGTPGVPARSGTIDARPVVARRARGAFRTGRSIGLAFVLTLATTLLAGVVSAAGGETKTQAELLREAIFQGINLLILLAVLVYFGRRPIREYFATRREAIQDELAQAADLLARAEQRNSELQRRLVDLSSEIEEIRERATRRADDQAERILADARASADRIQRDARAAMDQELRRARAELRAEAADLALEIAARKLGEQVGDSDRERLLDEFITRVESAGTSTSGARPRGAES